MYIYTYFYIRINKVIQFMNKLLLYIIIHIYIIINDNIRK